MASKTIRYIIFSLLGLATLITVGYYFFVERTTPEAVSDSYVNGVQHRVDIAVGQAKKDLSALADVSSANGTLLLRSTLPESYYPYLIFKNGEIIHWSDNAFVPSYQEVSSGKAVHPLSVNGNLHIVVSIPLNDPLYECFSLIPVVTLTSEWIKFNESIFSIDPKLVDPKPALQRYKNIRSADGEFLFSVQPPVYSTPFSPLLPATSKNLLSFTLVIAIVLCLLQISDFKKKHWFGRAFLVVIVFLITIRWLFLVNSQLIDRLFPSLFDPELFPTSSTLLGNRLINGVVWFILIGFLATYAYRTTLFYKIQKSGQSIRSLASISCVVIVFGIAYVLQSELADILYTSNGKLTYGLTTSFSIPTVALMVYYLLLSGIFFLGCHVFLHLFTRLQPKNVGGLMHWLYGTILSFILFAVIDDLRWLYIVTAIYFALVYHFKLTRNFYLFQFQTSIYFFLGSFAFAVVSVSILSTYLNEKQHSEVQAMGTAFFANNDDATEAFINTIMDDIRTDSIVSGEIQREVLARERVVQHIRDNYLATFVNGYQTEINVFDADGRNLDILPDALTLAEYDRKINADFLPARFDNLFISKSEAGANYYATLPILRGQQKLGNLVLEFTDASLADDVDNRLGKNRPAGFTENYSVAVFDKTDKLVQHKGDYGYPDRWQPIAAKKRFHLAVNNITHYTVRNEEGKLLVISVPHKGWYREWSNLSFLFLASVLVILLLLIYYSLRYNFGRRSYMNFTTRIQLYLNSAFLLPLLLMLLIAISVVGTTLQSNQRKGFTNNSNSIASAIQLLLEDVSAGKMSQAYFEQEIDNLSQNSDVDIALYNQSGVRQYANKAFTNQVKNLSTYLLPAAYKVLMKENKRQFSVEETSGDREFLSTFTTIDPTNTVERTILQIPYYDARLLLNEQVSEIISSLLNVFIVLFLLLLLISYFFSRQLINPLRTVTSHLHKTNLDKLDEPLPLPESGDEMGILVRAYNRMLKKLEESKTALSTSEKQTAWREMAKQVAHEIKNPLTPMKLSIQQLQRTLPDESNKSKVRIERALSSLIEQIDNISEIANSFSEFAKMPVPRSENFDIVPAIQKAADLYANNQHIDIRLNFPEPTLLVRGDRQLISRVLTNLIINGLQSVAIDIRAEITISVYRNDEENFAIIEVQDNGAGIPEDIREKVFMPSFSTKVGGSGLGLALSKRGVEHGGGNIWFETEVGNGTTFFVSLPLARP